jgi:nucleoside phosphorylase
MANSLESGSFDDRLACATTVRGNGFLVRQGVVQGRPVAVMLVGTKPDQITRGVEALLFGHWPRSIAAAGFASGLVDRLERGDLVVADSITGAGGEPISLDRKLDRDLLARTPRLITGRLLTLEQSSHRPAEKRALGLEHKALAADRQSFSVAKVCRRENVPFFAVRVIVDSVDDDVPADVRRLTSRKTAAQRIGAIAGSLVRRPSAIKDLWNVYEMSLAASQTLAKFLESVVVARM